MLWPASTKSFSEEGEFVPAKSFQGREWGVFRWGRTDHEVDWAQKGDGTGCCTQGPISAPVPGPRCVKWAAQIGGCEITGAVLRAQSRVRVARSALAGLQRVRNPGLP